MKGVFLAATLWACSLSLWADIRYVEILSAGNAPSVELERIEDVQLVVREFGVKIGYLQYDQKKPGESRLLIIADGTHFLFDMQGYRSIDAFVAGGNGGFMDGADYQEAVSLGLADVAKPESSLYYFYRRNQFKSVDDCKDAFKKGFAFQETQWTDRNGRKEIVQEAAESSAYYKAVAAQLADYKEYQEFMPGLERGYKTKADIQDAAGKGFGEVKGYEYYTAMGRGFSKYEDYKAASDVGLESQSEFERYRKIVAEVESIMGQQKLEKREAFIYFYLCQIPKGQQSLAVLEQTLEEICRQQDGKLTKALDLYYSGIPSLAEWDKSRNNRSYSYGSSQYQRKSLDGLLSSSSLTSFFKAVDTSGIGRYDEKTGIFTRNGSNFIQVARNDE